MGNWQDSEEKQELQFYMDIDDKNLGNCSIYTSTKYPRCFIAKLTHSIDSKDNFNIFSKIENQQNIYLLSLYGYQFGKNCQCQSDKLVNMSVTSFWEYLSYTVKDAINHRKGIGIKFQQNELWHMIKACTQGYTALVRNNIFYDYMPSKMMINHEGRVRLSWFHVRQKNTHLNYFKAFNEMETEKIEEAFFSPEQLRKIWQRQINFEKANIFSLGMTLLYCMTLSNPLQQYYKGQFIDYSLINHNMVGCQKYYSKQLLFLVGSMLHQNPDMRVNFENINLKYYASLKGDHQIRMARDQRFYKTQKVSVQYFRST